MTEPLSGLTRALDATAAVVAGLDGTWERTTPCPDWTVRDLLEHLVGVHALFVAALSRAQPPRGVAPLGPDPAATYRRHADAVAAAFAAPGVLERLVEVPFGTVPGAVALELHVTETLTHGWDLAHASDRPTTGFPDDVAERALAFSRGALEQLPPERSPFAAPQPVDPDAPAIDRLAALLGRAPGARLVS